MTDAAPDRPKLRVGAADPAGILEEPDAHVWGGGARRGPDGRFYHVYARWAVEHGFDAWVTHSHLGWAVADSPFGPWDVEGVLIGHRDAWDQVLHNPDLHVFDGRYYLYYTANHGNGDWWTHRNHQRIGVAVADHPAGPWQRFDKPLIDVEPGTQDHLMTAHPAVARGRDGRYDLIYKSVSDGPAPFGGRVRWRVAIADHPLGPFHKQPEPIFDHPTAAFPADDTYLWHQGDRYYAIVKDQGGYFSDYNAGKALLLFESTDGLHYAPVDQPLLMTFDLPWTNGRVSRGLTRVDEPNVLLQDGRPVALYLSIRAGHDREQPDARSYKVQVPLSG